jgi:tetratricopeptide (TPR) repeat protein
MTRVYRFFGSPSGIMTMVVALLAVAAGVAGLRDRWYPAPPAEERPLIVRSGATLQRMTRGYNALAADVYWIRTVQYYGGERRAREQASVAEDAPLYPQLYPLLDLTTTLDPRFTAAYRFGAILLSEPPPSGPGRPDLAITLLEKALAEQADKWEYMHDIGFVYYWWLQDYAAASEWFDRASKIRGAPWFLRTMAASARTQGGDLRTARTMWYSIRETSDVDWLHRLSERSLMQLDAMEFMDELQGRIDQWMLRYGRVPANWQELVAARLVPDTPLDPSGEAYLLDDTGTMSMSGKSSLLPLPRLDHPATPGSR